MSFKVNKALKKRIKDSLMDQLKKSNMVGDHFENMVEDYLYLWELKEQLQYDIKENGLRITTINGNGIQVSKPNESVQNLGKVTSSMSKVLSDLGLFEPLTKTQSNKTNDYY